MACNGIRNDMSWNRLQSHAGLGFTGFSKLVNSVLSDLGAMSMKVTFLIMIVRQNDIKSCQFSTLTSRILTFLRRSIIYYYRSNLSPFIKFILGY
jgi:hypothetical protein